ncbi:hypothetical protein LWI29_008115 [Acer saccharum]|uniref:Ysc84 actin-binding domain-containing protein n=1 Tax=Acer saccharum TaxID=4024 RepID=A0AA39VFM5_ACESA|nr:hypothetical protein LWI29_008115 [Acer saccharum]
MWLPERGETSNSDIHRRRHCEVFDGTGDNSDDFDYADDIRDDFDGSCTTPATPPTVPFNHASNSSLQSRFEMYTDPEITPTYQETAQWYYDGLQNVDDLYPAPGSLDNMPDEYKDGRSTTPPQSRPTNAAGPSGAATPTPTPTTGVADIPTLPRRRFRADFESRVQDRLEIILDELRDSNRRREEEHAELMCIFRSYRHNDDQSHTPLGHSLSMSQYARSYHPFDPPVGLQNSAEVQDPPVGLQNSAKVQDPPVGQQNSVEVQDPPVGIQNSPNVQDPPLMAQQTSKVQDPPVNCRPVRLWKRGWQQTTPYTDPCKPKRAKSASHKFKPDEKVDAEVLADYVAFKEEPNGRRDVDIQLIVDVPWFVQFESNNSILEDTTNMVKWWEEMMPARTTDKPSEEWPVLSYKWTAEQIAWARGKNVGGCRSWNEVDTVCQSQLVGRSEDSLIGVPVHSSRVGVVPVSSEGPSSILDVSAGAVVSISSATSMVGQGSKVNRDSVSPLVSFAQPIVSSVVSVDELDDRIGGELMDFIIVLHDLKAVKTFCSRMHFSLGAGCSAAAGPVGRVPEADVTEVQL